MKSHLNLSLLIVFAICFFNCKKNDDSQTKIDSDQELTSSDQDSTKLPNPKKAIVALGKGNPWQLVDTTQWNKGYNNIDVFKFYINDIVDEAYSLQEKQDFIKVLKDKNIKIAVELGGLLSTFHDKGDQVAEFSFNKDGLFIQHLVTTVEEGGLGGYVDILEFDGPIHRILYPNKIAPSTVQNLDLAVSEFVEVIDLWREKFPNVEVNYVPSFPNWGWKGEPAYTNHSYAQQEFGFGDMHIWVSKLIQEASTKGTKINGLTLANGYDFVIGQKPSNQEHAIVGIDWLARINDLEATVRNGGWNFNLILNTQASSNDGTNYNEVYYNDILSFVDLYDSSNGKIDTYWIQAWYAFPSEWLPETQDYTMTNATKAVLEKVKN